MRAAALIALLTSACSLTNPVVTFDDDRDGGTLMDRNPPATCGLADHSGCGPDELCCAAGGESGCVPTGEDRCAACGVPCGVSADGCTARACTCGGGPSCGGGTPRCVEGSCVACERDADCTDRQCVAGACEECDPADHAGCSGTRPICDVAARSCGACGAAPGSECNAGVCVTTGPRAGACGECDPADSTSFGDPCDGLDAGECSEGTTVCIDRTLQCEDFTGDDIEVCNGFDDDCDASIDEDADCPCPHHTFGGHSYLFCGSAAWQAASDACPEGYELTRVDDVDEHVFLVGEAHAIAAGDWWLGGSASLDAMWRWLVGGDLIPRTGGPGFSNWAPGEPNSTTECLGMDTNTTGTASLGGRWDDLACTTSRPYICESLPLP